ncbi:uncharacterized protein KQ657_003341 [Scheffersomyces spartinae]|uniref:Mediator complex subunit 22 n=1 Tax=Scheffersomyces spartinae TaxID=45513 RepID=A0A9P8AKZ2_9ASCO|nr:uncharacterized protein KQ657_003341 [Scheffersomyces spartinae]KAG7195574.1 hypothetical protein KQ657_003341 [Scheffersomyces spartinae]
MQQKSIAILQRIDTNVEQVLTKFQRIFELAVVEDKSKELLAVESLTMEADALSIIRLCEDLLSITRNLKETWCLGSIKVSDNKEQWKLKKELRKVYEQFNKLTDNIAEFETKQTV